jgi:opacity protein-like surface antigen
MGYPNSSFNYTADGTTISAEYSGAALDALANAKYYFVNGFNVVGRLGVAYANQKVSINITQGSTSTPQSQQNSKLMPETGIGFGYDFNNGLGLNFTYNYLIGAHIDPSPNLEKFAPVSTYLIGLSYTFLS